MGKEPSNSELHVLLTETNGNVKHILSKIEEVDKWRVRHEQSDKQEHDSLHKRISDMRTSMHHIAIVSVLIGFIAGSFSKIKSLFLGG